MIVKLYRFIVLAMLLVIQAAAAAPVEDKNGFWEAYNIIAERNIFSRSRSGFSKDSGKKEVFVPKPQSYLILKGIVRQKRDHCSGHRPGPLCCKGKNRPPETGCGHPGH